MSLRKVMSSFAAFACLVAAALSVGVQPAIAAPTTTAVFNNPLGTADEKAAIQTRLVELIDGAPAGSRIRMSMFYASDATVPNALIAAKNRGVEVQVIFNDNDPAKAPYASLVTALGTDLSAPSWILFCPAGRGCIGDRVLSKVGSINHDKFFLFSSTQGASDVVVQSTANLHTGRDGLAGWNAALVLVGNTNIYNAYSGYFDDLKARGVNNNTYDTGRPAVTSGNAKVHFYPRQESNGQPYDDASEDTIMTALNHVSCFGNSVVGTQDGSHRTIIRVNQAIFSRTYIASKLWELDNAGCYVEVVERYDQNSKSEAGAMKNLLAATSSPYGGPVVKYYCIGDSVWTHSKYLQVEGNYYGRADRTITWVGSHNFSYNSLRQSDETLLQLEDSTVFDAFRTNFRTVRDAPGIRSVANGGTAACP
ncbi:Phosphatidylserine/phosphatidylglycerophosphate/cardiolipin synthase [Micromonospora rhizosphaerae]|uniref:phospholipase D n=1 Tax=Micromonospora rhizosphaerae TaxID=568872 RepID=A0A1C6SRV1_9ACTN|nr:phospholipase D-like domain-containing protein [Micromonospora rhizosphaerae]SCL32190.1 Phosphatidylserine/phosphatidylglycerophosphate/cardiolipin synthase [Micromonospora rhizosphaerae]